MNTETDYKNELVQTLWDLFKEVHGVRPRGMGYEKYSVADLEHEVAHLQRQLEANIRWEREQEDRAINTCMDAGASDIATAMRWLEDAYEMEWV
jgi:5-carboxymethyl-2-hydroxymuconate isomerase